MEKELRLIGVNKKYKLSNRESFQALYDINVEFDKGELVSIVGESGSGKSTLMNLIGGLDSDFSGDILVGKENLRTLTDKQLDNYRKNKIGFVFQSFNLISHLSILDNVTLALTLSNVSEKEKIEKATQMLKRVGLENQLKKKPTQLSGGQKQRVAIARALINDPEIIIADEPTGALDSETSMQILQILKEIADSGKLVLMVTHSEKVASISSRVVTISDGKITGDHLNENYVKNEEETSEIFEVEPPVLVEHKKKKHNSKNTQNLSMISAIRLSFHNMWASKIKNFLMAFGVAIGIGSLILMMCFSSGITDFINDTMKSYSDPTIVTISKRGDKDSLASLVGSESFSQSEIDEISTEINTYLAEKGIDFEINESNLEYGVQMMTMLSGAKVIYNPDNLSEFQVNYFDSTSDIYLDKLGLSYDTVIYMYTTPPFYSDKNVSEGKMSTATNGVMFSAGIKDLFPDNSIKNADGTNKQVDICFTYQDPSSPGQ